MKLTKNAKIFGIIGVASSLTFFYLLDKAITDKSWSTIWIIAIIYGLVWFVSGLLLGRADDVRKHRGNLSLLYHAVSTVVTLGVAALAVVLWDSISATDWLWVSVAMLVGFAAHWLGTRGDTKGIEKKEAFK